MNTIFKITAIGLVGGILSVLLKDYKREFSLLCALATTLIIVFYTINVMKDIISPLEAIIEKSGVDRQYFTTVIRVVGIAYLTQFACELLRDSGENAIAVKTELAGKIFVLSLTVPIMTSFLEVCAKVLDGI